MIQVAHPAVSDLTAAPLLEARSISKSYGPVRAVAHATFGIRPGEIVALVGENGAGKTTLLRCLAGDERPDSGQVVHRGSPVTSVSTALERGIAMVWQDLALCENLDTVQNVFLGRETGRTVLTEARMRDRAIEALDEVGIPVPDVTVPVWRLPVGQRQAVALARAVLTRPSVLLLDEPTAALGVADSRLVGALIRRLSAEGTSVLFATHDVDEVFRIADRVLVLRQGRVTSDQSRHELHPDDLAALMSGVRIDTTASQQLRLLSSLDDQLSTADPSVALPITVTAMANALSTDMLGVFLTTDDAPGQLVRTAVVGLSGPILERGRVLPIGDEGGSVGRAAAEQDVVVVEDVRTHPLWARFRAEAAESGIQSTWAVPIMGRTLIGVVAGYERAVGKPRDDQLALVSLFASQAAAAIERTRLISELSSRNRHLEGVRGVLESLSGPDAETSGAPAALLAVCNATGAEAAALYAHGPHNEIQRQFVMFPDPGGEAAIDGAARLESVEPAIAVGSPEAVRAIGEHVVCIRFRTPERDLSLVGYWDDPAVAAGSHDMMADAARSFRIALERRRVEESRREADTLRRSNDLQRSVIMRLGHELRTPLTAIHGFASSMRQPDVDWRDDDRDRFLGRIETESRRIIRLVDDLLDSSAIEAGILRLENDWCELPLVIQAAVDLVPGARAAVAVELPPAVPPIWADHDRLQQVFVNLIANAIAHNADATTVSIGWIDAAPGMVAIRVADDGKGLPHALLSAMLRGSITEEQHRGLGLKIATGIVESHGGTLLPELAGTGASFIISLPAEPSDDAVGPGVR